jgi:hypothetical protein
MEWPATIREQGDPEARCFVAVMCAANTRHSGESTRPASAPHRPDRQHKTLQRLPMARHPRQPILPELPRAAYGSTGFSDTGRHVATPAGGVPGRTGVTECPETPCIALADVPGGSADGMGLYISSLFFSSPLFSLALALTASIEKRGRKAGRGIAATRTLALRTRR